MIIFNFTKILLLFLLLLYSFICIFFVFSTDESIFNVFIGNSLGLVSAPWLFFPSVFILESFFIKKPFFRKDKILFALQGLLTCFFLYVLYFAIGFYSSYLYQVIDYDSSFYPWLTSYRWLVFFFGLWSFVLAVPDLNKLKFFNWPFERDENAPKEWIPPRER